MPQCVVSLRVISPALVLAFAVAACHKAPALTPPVPASGPAPAVLAPKPTPPPPPQAPPLQAPAPPVDDESSRFARMSLDALNATHPLGDVQFDYDRSALSDEARKTLDADFNWLKKWPSTVLLIEGHADERGTAEYNLALGERRAAAARSYLENLGIAHARLNVVSKGEESPVCTERNETCWQRNRRAHLVITGK